MKFIGNLFLFEKNKCIHVIDKKCIRMQELTTCFCLGKINPSQQYVLTFFVFVNVCIYVRVCLLLYKEFSCVLKYVGHIFIDDVKRSGYVGAYQYQLHARLQDFKHMQTHMQINIRHAKKILRYSLVSCYRYHLCPIKPSVAWPIYVLCTCMKIFNMIPLP